MKPVNERRDYKGIDTPPLDVESVTQTLKEKNILPSMLKFGFLGLGIMGSGIVKNLLNSGHSVIVWNRTPAKPGSLAQTTQHTVATPLRLSQSVVFNIVKGSQGRLTELFHRSAEAGGRVRPCHKGHAPRPPITRVPIESPLPRVTLLPGGVGQGVEGEPDGMRNRERFEVQHQQPLQLPRPLSVAPIAASKLAVGVPTPCH
ncbi:hypothetical protein B566_EDAN011439 [Ephemera danica]|nr:hypothetical protein B566_EDAN011439 [Ephemera danica]